MGGRAVVGRIGRHLRRWFGLPLVLPGAVLDVVEVDVDGIGRAEVEPGVDGVVDLAIGEVATAASVAESGLRFGAG